MKQTEIGLIPEDWEVKEFKQEATLINGRAYAQSELLKQGKYKVLRVGNFGTNDTWYYSNLELPEKQYCTKGDLLYCWSCTYGAYIWNEPNTIYHYHIWKIISKGADKEYLKYILNNDTENQMKTSNGSTMAHITKGFLENRLFVFPPLPEQQRIAKALSDVDALISTTEKLIQKKKNIKQGAMQNLLTGKKRLPGFGNKQTDLFVPNGTHTKEVKDVSPEQIRLSAKMKQTELGEIPEDWEVKTLGEISTIIMGQSPNSDCYNTQKGMVLIQGNADISNRKTICRFYTTHITKTARKGDVIFTVRAPVGNVAKATFDCCLGRGVCAIQRISDFLYYYLIFIEDSWSKTSTGSTFDSINSDTLASTLIIQPSSKEEQTAIANVLSSMDKEIETLNTKLEKYRNLKTAMMQQLLTGKIRLV